MSNEEFDPSESAARLLGGLGWGRPDTVVSLPGGRNNRVWRVESSGRSTLLKRYFWSEGDTRDRQGQEWAFLSFLKKIGCRLAPAPLACERESRCSLLEFIEGSSVDREEITPADIGAAVEFLRQVNERQGEGTSLPPVSEACFSLESHLAVTASRVLRLGASAEHSGAHEEIAVFVKEELEPLWRQIDNCVRTLAGDSAGFVLSDDQRGLSPSDFGFHNALREAGGRIRFVDFEYAGWDDPAKTIIDFCNQPDLLLAPPLAALFREEAGRIFAFADLEARLRLLEPVYQLKWSCICLNGFLPGNAGFSLPGRSAEGQFLRARTMAARAAERLDGLRTCL